ncbi:MAG TPA: amidase [Thermoanaerobaculia bacterium]|nr:amidase [Thermoanaerobaculia bacterium]HQN06367.1 amidase [Thermoanaerobaculia bacterium]HQP86209.1 amidase [Thermoanaerobaculia bacterium]
MTDLAFRPATALLGALERKETSSEELLRLYLTRIERLGSFHAVVTLDTDRALAEARACDAERARGERRGPLHGLPVTVKDSFETADLRTTSGGTPELMAHVPARDATVVARLKAAGAIVFGKTNLSTQAMDIQTYNAAFGTTPNPWDASRTAGGSSGGSAVAMSTGLSALEVGSDLGGSIRIPSAFCGVFGHRPSYGIVPTRGHIPGPPGTLAAPDLETAGPIARSADDLDLALRLLAGPDEGHAVAWRLELPPPRRRGLSEYRLAAWLDDPAAPVDTALRERLEAVIGELRAAGAEVDTEARPGFAFADNARLFMQVLYGSMSAGLPEGQFEKIRARAAALAPEDDSFRARLARDTAQTHREFDLAREERERRRARWAELFERYDALLCPVFPTPAFPHDQSPDFARRTLAVNGAHVPYLGTLLGWPALSGLASLPGTSAPVGFTREGLPAGIQVVGPYLEDRTAIHVAKLVAEVAGGCVVPPGVE